METGSKSGFLRVRRYCVGLEGSRVELNDGVVVVEVVDVGRGGSSRRRVRVGM